MGKPFDDLEKQIRTEALKGRLDRAVLMAIQDQNVSRFDFMTDGEERRGHSVLHVLKRLNGIDRECLAGASSRKNETYRSRCSRKEAG
jgi:methionine synthase II (cobalamin-independent)